MPELKLEVTEELMRKIEEAAKENLVTPSHWATCMLKSLFLKRPSSPWLVALPPIVRHLADTLEDAMCAMANAVQKVSDKE